MEVQNLIVKGIREQLFRHEFLVLPDFGGFILKKTPAYLSGTGGMLHPPSKTIGFNLQLKQNDGVMQQWLCNKLNCSAAEAHIHLKEFADYCKAVLSNTGRLNVDGIGFFYSDLEKNISFEPLKDNFLSSSFGLEPLAVKEIEQEAVKTETDFTDRILTHLETEQKANSRRFRTYHKVTYLSLGLIALLSALFIVVSNSKFTGKIQSAIFHSEGKSTYAPIQYTGIELNTVSPEKKDYVADANGIAAVELDDSKTVAVRAVEVENKTDKKNRVKARGNANFEVVLGCFSIESNARKLVRKLKAKGIDAYIAGRTEKGLRVVSGGGYNTKEEALTRLNVLRSNCPNAWIWKAN